MQFNAHDRGKIKRLLTMTVPECILEGHHRSEESAGSNINPERDQEDRCNSRWCYGAPAARWQAESISFCHFLLS